MAKKKPAAGATTINLFGGEPKSRRRRVLILPRLLEKEADAQYHHDLGPEFDKAHAILTKWADMETNGQLAKKEKSLDANFLIDIFGNALRYPTIEQSAAAFLLDREMQVPGVGPVDGALGQFPTNPKTPTPAAVIELKDADTDLDTDKSNGRTAVQQLFDYLNALPNTKWGIVSNFSTIRLYYKDRGTQAYEIFSLQQLRNTEQFKAFWCLLERGGLIPSVFQKTPRADALLIQTGERQKEVGDELYNHYSLHRNALIATLRDDFAKPLDEAIRIAQKIFDRIMFVAFCEDRGLINAKSIERAHREAGPFSKIKNPRWQNFLGIFHGIDKGHPDLGIEHGYNGGLFADDPAIDTLDLPDEPWTSAFNTIGGYEFKDEVNVDVLGHIFERSITELEKLRMGGLFAKLPNGTNGTSSKMQKSAERKRFGIYYTPPEFTGFIVKQTIGELLKQRFADLEKAHGVTPQELAADYKNRTPNLAAYYQQCLQTLRNLKVVDPACGSGAFLIAAYELLEDSYDDIIRHIIAQGVPNAATLPDQIPDFILTKNLYGVDLSEEAVEITRLALWIRSARPGKTLADLSQNIIWGNSLVDDNSVHPKAMNWKEKFSAVFTRPEPGFDSVIGNPPWERMKLQEREFFAFSAPEIASAVNAATRRKLIEKLETKNPELFAQYEMRQQLAENTSNYVRACGRYPLTAQGDINTYMLFAELARTLVAAHGRVGVLVPSGIATDSTTKEFFADLVNSETLIKFYDFENREGIFQDVDGRFKFCTLIIGGPKAKTVIADFVFFAHKASDLEDRNRHIALSKKDIALFNPNTRTCPIFRSRRDAELTKQVYKKIPILVDDSRKEGGNPWAATYFTMFHQTNDAEVFVEPEDLKKKGFKLQGNHFVKGKQNYLPLYEAKMIQAYDHRAGSVLTEEGNWVRQGQTDATSTVQHQNPEYAVIPRWWVMEENVDKILGARSNPAYLAFKDVTSSTNQRTMIAAFVPHVALVNSAPLLLFGDNITFEQQTCFLANLNSVPYDFIARQKVGGNHLNFFIVEQLPTLPPETYADKCPWNKKQTLKSWISERVLKLTCTANDLIPLAKACNFNPDSKPPYIWKWKEQERADLRAQLDAAYFHLYGISRDDVIYILSTFQATGDPTDRHSTASLVLEHYDRITTGAK